jgi:hypothetical protein
MILIIVFYAGNDKSTITEKHARGQYYPIF